MKGKCKYLPQYLSAVRQIHLLRVGTPVPTFPKLYYVLRAYSKWEEENYPQEVRVELSATNVQRIIMIIGGDLVVYKLFAIGLQPFLHFASMGFVSFSNEPSKCKRNVCR